MQDDDADFDDPTGPELSSEEEADQVESAISGWIDWLEQEPEGPFLIRDLDRDQQLGLAEALDESQREFGIVTDAQEHYRAWQERRRTWGVPLRRVGRARERLIAALNELDLAAKALASSDRAHSRWSGALIRQCDRIRTLIAPISVPPVTRIRTNPRDRAHRDFLRKYRQKFFNLFWSFGLSRRDAIVRTHKVGYDYWNDKVSLDTYMQSARRLGFIGKTRQPPH